MKKRNIVIGSIFIAISAFVWIYTEVAFPVETNVTIGSPFFPRMLSVALALLAIILMLQKHDTGTTAWKPSFRDPSFQRVMITITACILYTVLLRVLGFIIVASLLMFGLMYLLGYQKYAFMAGIAVGIAVLVQIVFEKLLGVVLPYGILAFIFYA